MAQLHIVVVALGDRALTGATLPIAPGAILRSKTLTPTLTSQIDPDLVLAEGEVMIATADADCWVRLKAAADHVAGPSASFDPTGGSHKVLAGQSLPLGADAGQKIAYRTVA